MGVKNITTCFCCFVFFVRLCSNKQTKKLYCCFNYFVSLTRDKKEAKLGFFKFDKTLNCEIDQFKFYILGS